MAREERGGAFGGDAAPQGEIQGSGPFNPITEGATDTGSRGGAFGSGATSGSLSGVRGPQGEAGPDGPKGDKGDTGMTGATGSQGERGNPGDKGDTGDTGAMGDQGDKGDTGDKGDKGDTGDTGATGTGTQGIQGPQGIQGDKGDVGDDGAAFEFGTVTTTEGPAGVAYTSTGTPGEFDASFTLPRGNVGATGMQGPKGDTGNPGQTGGQGDPGTPGGAGMQGPMGNPGMDATPTAILANSGDPQLAPEVTGEEIRTLIGAGDDSGTPAITVGDSDVLALTSGVSAEGVRTLIGITDEHHQIPTFYNEGSTVVIQDPVDVDQVRQLLNIEEPALSVDPANGNLTTQSSTSDALIRDALGAQQEITTVSLELESDQGSGGTVAGSALQITVAKTIQTVAITRGNDADTGALNNGTLTLDLVDGGNVEANPGTPTEELDTIRIDDVNYELAAGGTLVLPNDPLVVLSSLTQLNTVTIGLEEFRLPGAPIFVAPVASTRFDINIFYDEDLNPGARTTIDKPQGDRDDGTQHQFRIEPRVVGLDGTQVTNFSISFVNSSFGLLDRIGTSQQFGINRTTAQVNAIETYDFDTQGSWTETNGDDVNVIVNQDQAVQFFSVRDWYTFTGTGLPTLLSQFSSRGRFTSGDDFRFSGGTEAYVLIPQRTFGTDDPASTYTFKSGVVFLNNTVLLAGNSIATGFSLYELNDYDGSGDLDVTITLR